MTILFTFSVIIILQKILNIFSKLRVICRKILKINLPNLALLTHNLNLPNLALLTHNLNLPNLALLTHKLNLPNLALLTHNLNLPNLMILDLLMY